MKDIKIISITGPSGVGKTTLARELLRTHPDWGIVVSITTREPRPSDLRGEYRYISHEEFEEREAREEFIWAAEVHGIRNGTLFASIDEALEQEGAFSYASDSAGHSRSSRIRTRKSVIVLRNSSARGRTQKALAG